MKLVLLPLCFGQIVRELEGAALGWRVLPWLKLRNSSLGDLMEADNLFDVVSHQ